jgi:hypothetical protein
MGPLLHKIGGKTGITQEPRTLFQLKTLIFDFF